MSATNQSLQLVEIKSRCSRLRFTMPYAADPRLPARVADEFRDLVWILARAECSEALDAASLKHLATAKAAAEIGLVLALQLAGMVAA